MGAEQEEEVSTIFVGGLPLDATPRELDNLCRFMPGFVNSKVDAKKGKTLFARFDAQSNALSAISMLQGQAFDRTAPGEQTMRAALAKGNMKCDRPPSHTTPYAAGLPPPVAHAPVGAPHHVGPPGYGGHGGPPGRRPRAPGHPGEVDTIASVGAAEAGFDEAALHGFFAGLPGFVVFKPNPRMGGGFSKFETPELAIQAINAAQENGIPAEMAKSSMSFGTAGQPPPPATVPPPGHGHGTKRPRMAENPNQIDTVASVGAAEAGIDEASLHEYFSGLHGFVMFKPNPRMGGGFAKFDSPSSASEAVVCAQQQGVPAELAKSSMNTGGHGPVAVPPPQQLPALTYAPPAKRPRGAENPGQVDTVAVVGAAERGFDELALQSFFMDQPGFLAFKANPRMGGGFAKFESPELASECVAKGQSSGMPMDIAKSSMSSVH